MTLDPWLAKAAVLVSNIVMIVIRAPPLGVVPFVIGIVCLAVGLWFFHRSHADFVPGIW